MTTISHLTRYTQTLRKFEWFFSLNLKTHRPKWPTMAVLFISFLTFLSLRIISARDQVFFDKYLRFCYIFDLKLKTQNNKFYPTMNWLLLRRAIFLWLSTRLCMREVRASQKTWKPTTTSFGRGWLSYWPSASQTSICWRLRPTWTASMTFSPQLFWRAHPTIRFISGAYFSKTFTTQLKIIQILLWEQCVISHDHDDLLMILFEPRLDEVRRLENFLDGCQNRVGWHFLCSFTFSLIFDIFVLQWHFRWSLQFSLIVSVFIEKT